MDNNNDEYVVSDDVSKDTDDEINELTNPSIRKKRT